MQAVWSTRGKRWSDRVCDTPVELAVDAGELHSEIEALRTRLAEAEHDQDRWRAEVERRLSGLIHAPL